MTTTLLVGLSRGAASCQVSVDCTEHSPGGLRNRLDHLLADCEQLLYRQTDTTSLTRPTPQPSGASDNGQRSTVRTATEKQVKAIYAIAGKQEIDLNRTLHDRFGASSVKGLSISEASQLIDELKQETADL